MKSRRGICSAAAGAGLHRSNDIRGRLTIRPKAVAEIGGRSAKKMGIKTYFCSDVLRCTGVRFTSLSADLREKMIFNEDMVMAAKIIQSGYKVAYAAEAKVIHSHNYSCMQQFKEKF